MVIKGAFHERTATADREQPVMNNDKYDADEIEKLLITRWAGRKLIFYNTTDSTNQQAKIEAEQGAEHGTLIVSDRQIAGRGRRGRSWESPAGTNIYFTLLLRPDFAPDKASMLTLVMAHAVSRAIMQETGLECKIKWPNDIVVNGRKVCGILTEMSIDKDGGYYVVVGVGVNVGRQEFASELAQKAASLEEEINRQKSVRGQRETCVPKEGKCAEMSAVLSRGGLIAAIMKCFEEDYEVFGTFGNLAGLLESYNRILINRDTNVRVLDPQGEYEGIARGITETGELLVERADGTVEQVYAGEVSVRGIYGYV